MGGDEEHGHHVVDQGNRSVLHLGGRVTLGMDITDLFQFQRALQRHGVVPAAAEIEEVGRISIDPCEVLDLVVLLQHLFYLVGNGFEFLRQHRKLIVAERAFGMGKGEGEERQTGELTGEGLRGGNAYLGSHMDIDARVGLACDGGAYGIDNAEDAGTPLLGELDGGQRVGRLTALRDGNDDISRIDHGVAVTEL